EDYATTFQANLPVYPSNDFSIPLSVPGHYYMYCYWQWSAFLDDIDNCFGDLYLSVDSAHAYASVQDPVICSGDTTILNATGAQSYSWSPATWLSSATGNSVNAFPGSSLYFYVTGTDA